MVLGTVLLLVGTTLVSGAPEMPSGDINAAGRTLLYEKKVEGGTSDPYWLGYDNNNDYEMNRQFEAALPAIVMLCIMGFFGLCFGTVQLIACCHVGGRCNGKFAWCAAVTQSQFCQGAFCTGPASARGYTKCQRITYLVWICLCFCCMLAATLVDTQIGAPEMKTHTDDMMQALVDECDTLKGKKESLINTMYALSNGTTWCPQEELMTKAVDDVCNGIDQSKKDISDALTTYRDAGYAIWSFFCFVPFLGLLSWIIGNGRIATAMIWGAWFCILLGWFFLAFAYWEASWLDDTCMQFQLWYDCKNPYFDVARTDVANCSPERLTLASSGALSNDVNMCPTLNWARDGSQGYGTPKANLAFIANGTDCSRQSAAHDNPEGYSSGSSYASSSSSASTPPAQGGRRLLNYASSSYSSASSTPSPTPVPTLAPTPPYFQEVYVEAWKTLSTTVDAYVDAYTGSDGTLNGPSFGVMFPRPGTSEAPIYCQMGWNTSGNVANIDNHLGAKKQAPSCVYPTFGNASLHNNVSALRKLYYDTEGAHYDSAVKECNTLRNHTNEHTGIYGPSMYSIAHPATYNASCVGLQFCPLTEGELFANPITVTDQFGTVTPTLSKHCHEKAILTASDAMWDASWISSCDYITHASKKILVADGPCDKIGDTFVYMLSAWGFAAVISLVLVMQGYLAQHAFDKKNYAENLQGFDLEAKMAVGVMDVEAKQEDICKDLEDDDEYEDEIWIQNAGVIEGYPASLGENSFPSLEEAQDACDDCEDATGVTMVAEAQYEVRGGSAEIVDGPEGAISWLKPNGDETSKVYEDAI